MSDDAFSFIALSFLTFFFLACFLSRAGPSAFRLVPRYIQRRLMKAMEDVMVHYDRTVRNSICEVLQFLYGEDGMNGEYVEDQTVELMLLDNEKLRRLYRHDVEQQEGYGKGWILDEEVRNEILTDFELQQVLEEEFEAIKEDKNRLCRHIFKDGETKQHIPINVLRLLEFAKAQFPATTDQLRKQNPLEIVKKVNELLQEKLVVVKQTNKTDSISLEVQDNATIFMKAHLRTVLNSRRLLERERLGPKAFQVSLVVSFSLCSLFLLKTAPDKERDRRRNASTSPRSRPWCRALKAERSETGDFGLIFASAAVCGLCRESSGKRCNQSVCCCLLSGLRVWGCVNRRSKEGKSGVVFLCGGVLSEEREREIERERKKKDDRMQRR